MSSPETLSIASINTALANGFGDHHPRKRFARLSNALQVLKPDVVLFQEVDSMIGLPGLRFAATELGTEYEVIPAQTYSARHPDRCSAIMTRLPVIDEAVHVFQQSHSGMGVQIAELTGPNGSIAAANMYLEADPWRDVLRLRKLGELARLLDDSYGAVPQIVGGDFNATPGFPSMKLMQRAGFVSAHNPDMDESRHFTFPTDLQKEQIVQGGCQQAHQYQIMKNLARLLRASGVVPQEAISAAGLLRLHVDHIYAKNVAGLEGYGVVHDVAGDALSFSDHCGIQTRVRITQEQAQELPQAVVAVTA